jgi:hypothetical protein
VLVACVAEDRPRDRDEVRLLFRSLQRLGGGLAGCRQLACFVERVDGAFRDQLAALGVESRVVARVDPRCPHANKIGMLAEADPAVDWVVALDTDVAVAGDLSPHLRGGTVRAKPADHDPLGLPQWAALFRHFGRPPPAARHRTTLDAAATVAYFNSGVLLVPGALAAPLAARWAGFVGRVLDARAALPALGRHAFFTDQIALALALADLEIAVDPLPLALNFPTHLRVHPSHEPDGVEPLLLHHHHRRSADGAVRPCGYRGPDRAIAAVNASA